MIYEGHQKTEEDEIINSESESLHGSHCQTCLLVLLQNQLLPKDALIQNPASTILIFQAEHPPPLLLGFFWQHPNPPNPIPFCHVLARESTNHW